MRNDVISTPTVATCTPPGDFYQLPWQDPGAAGPDVISQSPMDDYCVFVGATESYILALDEEAAAPPRDPNDPNMPVAGAPPNGSCLWHFKTHNQVWRNPVTPDCIGTECNVIIGSKQGYLGRFDRYPQIDPDGDRMNDPTNPLNCDMTVRD